MPDEVATAIVDATPAADTAPLATAAPDAAPAASPESAGAPSTSAQGDAAAAEPVSSPSLISTADADKASAKEIGDKPADAPADAAKPATADTEATPKDASSTDKPAVETAPAEKAPAQEPQARSYEAFKTPEGVTLAQKETKEFTDLLDDGKLSHQERAQKLVDLYVRESQRFTQDIQTQQRKAWSDFTDGLKADFKADPVLGGNRQDTTLGIAKAVIERFGGDDAQKSDLYAMLDHTGMGNHKGLVRVLNNVYESFMRESSAVPGNPPALRSRGSRQDAFYGSDG
jgi:hypothetical protein